MRFTTTGALCLEEIRLVLEKGPNAVNPAVSTLNLQAKGMLLKFNSIDNQSGRREKCHV